MSPSRRRALHLGAVGLAGALAGCVSGMLDDAEGDDSTTRNETRADPTTTDETETDPTTTGETGTDPTTHPAGVDTSLPQGSVEFPEGPRSPPERPDDLTVETVREYVRTHERRHVYNSLYSDETSEVDRECGVESVTEYGEGFRVVVRCSASSNTERDGSTLHADYFTRYATYFVGRDSTVRREGKSRSRGNGRD